MSGKGSVTSATYHGMSGMAEPNKPHAHGSEKDHKIQELMKQFFNRAFEIRSHVPNDACELSEHCAYRMRYADFFPEQRQAIAFIQEVEKSCCIYIQVLGPTLEDLGENLKRLSQATERPKLELYQKTQARLNEGADPNPYILLEEIKARLNVETVYFRYAKTNKVSSFEQANLYTFLETRICRVLNKHLTWANGCYKRFGPSFRLECLEGISFHHLVKEDLMLSLVEEVAASCAIMRAKMKKGHKFSKHIKKLIAEIEKKSKVSAVVTPIHPITPSRVSKGGSSGKKEGRRNPSPIVNTTYRILYDDPEAPEKRLIEAKMGSSEKTKAGKRDRSPHETSPKAEVSPDATIRKEKKKHKKSSRKSVDSGNLEKILE